MVTDRQGNRVSGATPDAVALFDQALAEFNVYRGDPVATIDRALAAAPGFVMAHALKAYLLGLATEPQATAQASQIVAERARAPDERSRALASRDPRGAPARQLDAAAGAADLHNVEHPHDLLALQAGHLMDFYRASARDLRDRLARALPRWSAATPGRSILLGMYAFGLEETGDYARAEAVGREAIDGDPYDCWAHHAVAHVMEMQGRAQDGIGWAAAREPYWAGGRQLLQGPQLVAPGALPPGSRPGRRGPAALRRAHPREPQRDRARSGRRVRPALAALPDRARRGVPVGGARRVLGSARRRPSLPLQRLARRHGPARRRPGARRSTAC